MRKVHEQCRNVSSLQKLAQGLGGLALAAALVVGAGAAVAGAKVKAAAPFGPWQAQLMRDHPLVGRIVDAASLKPLSRAQLEKRLEKAPLVILGEVHDNADHHRIQGILLRAFARGKARRPAVAFEMIPQDKAPLLAALKGAKRLSVGAVFDMVDWDHSGWPSRRIYAPVMEAAVDVSGVPLPAGLEKDRVRRIGREGIAALSRTEIGRLGLGPLPPEAEARLEEDIVRDHCNMIPKSAAKAMSAVQRVRDALLAAQLVQGWKARGSAALITGNGHARKDRGAPFYLARWRKGQVLMGEPELPEPLVVWQVEVREGAKSLADLLPKGLATKDLADVIIVTPAAKRKDPCESFRRFMDEKRRREGGGAKGGKGSSARGG